ncbi:Mindbomb E3 ubiquitin protein ligase 2 [Fragilaria crotonensis]|nr:Mindbomb E3 ubiquitin protein ligase 2 [Fragilaria crotonensis]
MRALVISSEETGLKATGVSVTVPDYDVCRLSYYLKCGTVSCGLDVIVDELVDFKNAHKLPKARQDAIFRLAYDDFDLEKLANVTIFLDDENQLLPKGTRNEFYDVSTVSNILAIQENAIIGGKHKEIRKIMVCDKDWLEKYYVKPLQNNSGRLSRILSGGTSTSEIANISALLGALVVSAMLNDDDDHCDHCKGGSGECACKSGCAVKSSTKCSASRKHCSHCKGLDGICCCDEGCPAKAESLCKVVHSGIICDSCHSRSIEGPIEGARYKCNTCPNYDLCEKCYHSGAHNKTHAFERYDRVGSTACFLLPRRNPSH